MMHGREPHEISLANSATLVHLLRRLVQANVLPRAEVLALLGNAADELVKDPEQTTPAHHAAAEIIRKELVPQV